MSKHQGIRRYRLAWVATCAIVEAFAIVVILFSFLPFMILAKGSGWAWGISVGSRIKAFTYKRMCRVEARIRVIDLHMRHHKTHTA